MVNRRRKYACFCTVKSMCIMYMCMYTLYIIQCISNQLGVTDVQAISMTDSVPLESNKDLRAKRNVDTEVPEVKGLKIRECSLLTNRPHLTESQ